MSPPPTAHDAASLQSAFRAILDEARRAPSGVNAQPWQVLVLSESVARELVQRARAQWPQVLQAAQARFPAASARALQAQVDGLQAPLAALGVMDNRLGLGSELDFGMLLESVRQLAAERGLAADVLPVWQVAVQPGRELLPLEEHQRVLCGVRLAPAEEALPEGEAPALEVRWLA